MTRAVTNSKALGVVCPKCGAHAGVWCLTPKGYTATRPHKERAVAYLAALASAPNKPGKAKVVGGKTAGKDHAVVTLVGGKDDTYRRKPCSRCPWRKDATGEFPAEAFKHSASTAYDMSTHTFACHESGTGKPATCAGFLLRGANHNLAVRMKTRAGLIDLDQVSDGGHELHDSYRAMAESNGVDPSDAALAPCR